MATKTPKELAQAAADAALESLKAALEAERVLNEQLLKARAEYEHSSTAYRLQDELKEARRRSDSAFEAWRSAAEAVAP